LESQGAVSLDRLIAIGAKPVQNDTFLGLKENAAAP
jgi:hypothetical protein